MKKEEHDKRFENTDFSFYLLTYFDQILTTSIQQRVAATVFLLKRGLTNLEIKLFSIV